MFIKNLPKATKVPIVVMVTERFKFPPKRTVQIFEAPPLGDIPVKKSPSLISG